MGKLFRAIAMVDAEAASMTSQSVKAQRGNAFARKFQPERRWIWEIASGVFIVGTVAFISGHWPAATKLAAQQGVSASIDKTKLLLRLSGPDTTGPVRAPELVRAWFAAVGASGVQETQRVGPDGNKIPEWLIRAILNGNLVEVEVKGYGSATAFRGMAKGDADIGMASPEMNSAEVAQLIDNLARFSSSVEGRNIVTKARFALPSGDESQFANAQAFAPQRDGLKPAITEQAKRKIPPAPTRSDSAPPPAATIAPDLMAGGTTAPPVTAAVAPEPTSELTKRPPPVIAVVPQPGSRALPPLASIVALLSPPRVANELPVPPVAITSHSVTIADYPPMSIRRRDQGTVVIKYLVQKDGSVGDCTVTKPSGKSLLDTAACAIVQGRWKFKPAIQDGKPVSEFLAAEVVFKLAELPKDEPSPTIVDTLATMAASLLPQ